MSTGHVRIILFAMHFAVAVLVTGAALGQLPAPKASPEDLGLIIPEGEAKDGGGRRVLLNDEGGTPVVGIVQVEVGDRQIVILPDGRLTSVKSVETTPTSREFVSATKEEMIAELEKKFPGFKARSTRRYIYVYNTSEPFYQATSRILETMYPPLYAYCERQGVEVHEPFAPLVCIMFKTQEEYDQYRHMGEGIVAYYNSVSNRVIMYEQSRLAEVAPALAVKQSISTIAHEGVHQVLHNIGVQQRLSSWPMWISEGLPEFFAPTDVGTRVRWKGVGLTNDLRMHSLIEYVKKNRGVLSDGKLVRQTIETEDLDADGYAAAWALTYYLAKNQTNDFFAYMADVAQAKPLTDPEDQVALFTKHFGDDLAGIQDRMFAALKKLPYVDPIANQPHYVVVLDTRLRRAVMVTTSPASIQQWKEELAQQLPAAEKASARFNVRVFPNKALAQRAAGAVLN